MKILGFDIGGTKCAVITALWDGKEIKLLKKDKCLTNRGLAPTEMIDRLIINGKLYSGTNDNAGVMRTYPP